MTDDTDLRPIPHADRLESGALGREARLLRAMFKDYCKRHHGQDALCADCSRLLHYALTRLACCPFGNEKPTCLKCKIHCYRGDEKEKVKAIMRESGPRMLLPHPLLTAEHLIKNFKAAPPKPRNRHASKHNNT